MRDRIFDKQKIIVSKISEADLDSFLVDMDIGDDGASYYPLKELANSIINLVLRTNIQWFR